MGGISLRLQRWVHQSNEAIYAFDQTGRKGIATRFCHLLFEGLECVGLKSLSNDELCESRVVDSNVSVQLGSYFVHKGEELEFDKVVHCRWLLHEGFRKLVMISQCLFFSRALSTSEFLVQMTMAKWPHMLFLAVAGCLKLCTCLQLGVAILNNATRT